jgi:hypothetical protein
MVCTFSCTIMKWLDLSIWLHTAADSEITNNDGATTGRCRFCGVVGNSGLLSIGNVCADQICQDLCANACSKMLFCGHFCGGISDEQTCLPCLVPICIGTKNELTPKLTQDIYDYCMICFTDTLSCAPSIQVSSSCHFMDNKIRILYTFQIKLYKNVLYWNRSFVCMFVIRQSSVLFCFSKKIH